MKNHIQAQRARVIEAYQPIMDKLRRMENSLATLHLGYQTRAELKPDSTESNAVLAALLKGMVDEGTKEGVDVNEVVQDMDWSDYEMEKLFTPDREDDDDR